MIWPYSRIKALEQRLDDERDRNRRREDALLNRILTHNGAFPILEDEIYPEKTVKPDENDSNLEIEQKLADFKRENFDGWADEAGISPEQRERDWKAYQSTHREEILST